MILHERRGRRAHRRARGSLRMDEAIMRYIRREKGLIIGQRTAEDLKIDLGTAMEIPMDKLENVTLRGRDAKTGTPRHCEHQPARRAARDTARAG